MSKADNTSSAAMENSGIHSRHMTVHDQATVHLGHTIIEHQTNVTGPSLPGHSHPNQAILNWFSPLNFRVRQHDIFRMRQNGTGDWFLQSENFKRWCQGTEKMLWCPGIPGAGKTVLSAVVVNYLRNNFSNQSVGIGCIFCNHKEQEVQTAPYLIASLFKQLIQDQKHFPAAIPAVVEASYKTHMNCETRPDLSECVKLLQAVATIYTEVFIVVDALDECAESGGTRKSIVDALKSLPSDKIRVMVTSRRTSEIELSMRGSLELEIRADDNDIRKYLEDHIEGDLLGVVEEYPKLRDDIITTIMESSKGMFLLARLHIAALLNEDNPEEVSLKLSQLPKTLFEAYDDTWERVKQHPKRERVEQILSWICFTVRPLTVEELRDALAATGSEYAQFNPDRRPTQRSLTSSCMGLVIVDQKSQTVRLVHETTQAYFQEKRQEYFPTAQQSIALACMTYLSCSTFEEGHCPSTETIEARLMQNPFFEYSARNWGLHASGNVEEAIYERILEFIARDKIISSSVQVLLLPLPSKWLRDRYGEMGPVEFSAIHICAYFGLCKTLAILLKMGAKADPRDRIDRTPLSYAAEGGNEAMASFELEYGDAVDSRNQFGEMSLWIAAEKGREAIVRLLLEYGASADSEIGIRGTPLYYAAKRGNEAIVRSLLEYSDAVNSRNHFGETPLWSAAEKGHEATVRLLLEKGAEVDSMDPLNRTTPLSNAAKRGHEAIVSLLLAYGATVDSRNKSEETPLWRAVEGGHKAIVRLLLEKGAAIDSRDWIRRTPLLRAAETVNETMVRFLLEKGAAVNSRSKFDTTPLSEATKRGHEAICRLLLERGAEVDSRDK